MVLHCISVHYIRVLLDITLLEKNITNNGTSRNCIFTHWHMKYFWVGGAKVHNDTLEYFCMVVLNYKTKL